MKPQRGRRLSNTDPTIHTIETLRGVTASHEIPTTMNIPELVDPRFWNMFAIPYLDTCLLQLANRCQKDIVGEHQ